MLIEVTTTGVFDKDTWDNTTKRIYFEPHKSMRVTKSNQKSTTLLFESLDDLLEFDTLLNGIPRKLTFSKRLMEIFHCIHDSDYKSEIKITTDLTTDL